MTDDAAKPPIETIARSSPSNFAQIASAPKSYNATIDYGRFAAAIIITLFHAKAPLGYFFSAAVSFFIIAMVFLAMRSTAAEMSISKIAASRANRLLVPWVFWMAVYAVAKTAKNFVEGGDLNADFALWLPPKGTFGQLWFLPFAFLVSVTLTYSRQWLRSIAATRLGWVVLAGMSVGVSVSALTTGTHAGPEIAGITIYLIYLPSVAFGILLALAEDRIARLLITIGAVGLAIVLAPFSDVQTQQLLLGVPLACLALEARLPETSLARRLGMLSFGVYLTHLLVISALPRATGIDPSTLIGGVLCVVGATSIALLIDATPLRRFT